ncbi:efflux RND transporter permease subunit [Thermoactinomyces sp. CICC 10523]|uniref:efflux RND transporter permease subunit n=1 Tax=Thermoactinomyces sp. CICC 10523 TaxID=2767428 RepID=UPI00351C24A2
MYLLIHLPTGGVLIKTIPPSPTRTIVEVSILLHESYDINNSVYLPKIYIPFSNGQLIPLSQVATLKKINKPNVLYHLIGTNYAVITDKVADNQLGNVTTAAKKVLNRLHLPAHAKVNFNGAAEQQSQIFPQFAMALLIAMGIVYFVMVVTFVEGRSPFAILFSLPMALIGSILGLFLSGELLSIPSLIGALMLIGIVVTNAIILIDRAKTQWQQGKSIREALIDAGTVRFRPIWMTALCTMFALLPLALDFAEGGLIVITGGLFSSPPDFACCSRHV